MGQQMIRCVGQADLTQEGFIGLYKQVASARPSFFSINEQRAMLVSLLRQYERDRAWAGRAARAADALPRVLRGDAQQGIITNQSDAMWQRATSIVRHAMSSKGKAQSVHGRPFRAPTKQAQRSEHALAELQANWQQLFATQNPYRLLVKRQKARTTLKSATHKTTKTEKAARRALASVKTARRRQQIDLEANKDCTINVNASSLSWLFGDTEDSGMTHKGKATMTRPVLQLWLELQQEQQQQRREQVAAPAPSDSDNNNDAIPTAIVATPGSTARRLRELGVDTRSAMYFRDGIRDFVVPPDDCGSNGVVAINDLVYSILTAKKQVVAPLPLTRCGIVRERSDPMSCLALWHHGVVQRCAALRCGVIIS